VNKFLSILLVFSFLFPQEICEGECYTDEEAQNIELYITELEQKSSSDSLVIGNLQEQIQLYLQQTNIDSTIIENYIEQLKLKEDLIKELKPKWHENKYLWYSMGIVSMIVPIWGIGQIK
jgi:hypothetical protein